LSALDQPRIEKISGAQRLVDFDCGAFQRKPLPLYRLLKDIGARPF
jgi:hypothetical protein